MNRYSAWKYIVIGVAMFVGIVYTLPNFFPEVPAVQVSTSKANIKIDNSTLQTVEEALKAANVPYRGETIDPTGIKVRFADADTRLKAKDVLQQKLGENYIVALNQVSSSPRWLASIGALPMYLGLDLRGGVYFLEQVDMKAALDKAADRYLTDIRFAAAREEGAVRGHRARRPERRHPLPRRRGARQGKRRNQRYLPGSRAQQRRCGRPIQAHRQPQARKRRSESRTARSSRTSPS